MKQAVPGFWPKLNATIHRLWLSLASRSIPFCFLMDSRAADQNLVYNAGGFYPRLSISYPTPADEMLIIRSMPWCERSECSENTFYIREAGCSRRLIFHLVFGITFALHSRSFFRLM